MAAHEVGGAPAEAWGVLWGTWSSHVLFTA